MSSTRRSTPRRRPPATRTPSSGCGRSAITMSSCGPTREKRHHAHLLLEFVAGAPGEGLRETLASKHLETLQGVRPDRGRGPEGGQDPRARGLRSRSPGSSPASPSPATCRHRWASHPFYDPEIAGHWLDVMFASFVAPTGGPPGDSAECVAGTSAGPSKIPPDHRAELDSVRQACRRRALERGASDLSA